ncbi:MAG: hypothetical protein SGJ27_04255 [Candidatus Melainabacteria bacterium]|nr:hypothetical protein [Candidatus Melainabacteria bacterium]
MSTLWRGFASQFFLLMCVSNQSAFAAEPLVGNIEKIELGGTADSASLQGSAKTSTSSLNAFANRDGASLNSSANHGSSNLNSILNNNSKNLNSSATHIASPGLVLQGGIEDGGALNNSAKLIPDGASKPTLLKGETKQINFPIADSRDQNPPKKPVPLFPISITPSPFGAPHIIPPISSYTLSPGIGIVSTPGYNVPTVKSVKGVSAYVPGFEVSTVRSNDHIITTQQTRHSEGVTRSGGVTSYGSGYSVQSIRDLHYGTASGGGGGYSTGRGVVTYVSGFDVATVPSVNYTAANNARSNTNVITTRSGISSYVPGFEVAIASPPKVTNTWHPGKVEIVAMADHSKNTLSGVWYSPSSLESMPQLLAGTEALPANKTYAHAIVAEDNQGLKATAQILSKPHTAMGSDWDAWYDKVGRSIYSRWQRAEVGPGSAKVRINVDQFRNLSCEVVDFRPAAYVDSDSVSETAFRVTALRAVHDLSQYEIPELPPLPAHKYAVTFDIEMARAVNGPTGFIVAAPRF